MITTATLAVGSGFGQLLPGVNDTRQEGRADRMVVRSGGRVVFVKVAEIDWVEAAGDYVTLHAGPS